MVSGTNPPTWNLAIKQATEAPVTVGGLTAGTFYDFEVRAVNARGEGTSKTIERIEMAGAAGAAPAQVEGLNAPIADTSETSIKVSWTALASVPDNYVVRYRETGTGLWLIAGIVESKDNSFEIVGLLPNTGYEFEVSAVTSGLKGNATISKSWKTKWRQPKFSDLLMGEDDKEIDVSRIQMLFFTVIAAGFVVLKVISSHLIPVIPDGILLLMGISNGVYLTAKFIPQKR